MSRKLRLAVVVVVGSGLCLGSTTHAQSPSQSSLTLVPFFSVPDQTGVTITPTTTTYVSNASHQTRTASVSQFHPNWGTYVTGSSALSWVASVFFNSEGPMANWSWGGGIGTNGSSGTSLYGGSQFYAPGNTDPHNPDRFSSGNPVYSGVSSIGGGSVGYGLASQTFYSDVTCGGYPGQYTGDASVMSSFSGSWAVTYTYIPSNAWTGGGGGGGGGSGPFNWSDPLNWGGQTAPNGAGQPGYLGDTSGGTSGGTSLTLDAPVTLGALIFDSATSSYTIGGGNALTIQDGNGALLTVQRGSHTIPAPVAFASNTTADIEGSSNTLTLSGGTSLGSGVAVTKQGAGTISVSGDLKVGDGHTSAFTHAGGGVSVGGTLYVGYGTGGAGTYTLLGGALSASAGVNVAAGSTFEYDGGTLTANVDNFGRFNVRNGGTRTVTGNFVNEAGATLKTYGTTFTYTGTFTNNGTYFSDPADNYFNTLTVGRTGALKGGVGDRFFVSGDLRSASANAAGWDTRGAQVIFEGGTGSHVLDVTGADLGPTAAGYADNFAWGTLTLAAGDALALRDGNAAPGGGLYLGKLDLAGGLGQIGAISAADGLNVYYDPALNPLLADGTYALSGGGLLEPAQGLSPELSASLAAVPEPGCVGLLLAASALLARRARR